MTKAPVLRWAIIGVLAAGLAVLLGLVPFVGGDYYAHIGILLFLNITLVLGYRLLCLTGLYSFCHITFFAVGAYTSALLSSKLEYPVWICFIAAGIVAALFSAALIIPAARVRGVYFFLVTFGFLEVMNSVFLHWSSVTGGDAGILVFAPIIGTGTQTQDYFVILAFAVITVIVMYRIERSRFGRELAPIGSAEVLASVSGINVLRNRVLAFAIGAGFAGFAGSLFAHDAAYISANNFSMWGTIYILVWLVVGGSRQMWGPIVGAVAMTLIAEFLRMSGILQALFYSGVLLHRGDGHAAGHRRARRQHPREDGPEAGPRRERTDSRSSASRKGASDAHPRGAPAEQAVRRRGGPVTGRLDRRGRRDHRRHRAERRRQEYVLQSAQRGHEADRGPIVFEGPRRDGHASRTRIAKRGLVRTFQGTVLFSDLSVFDNVLVASHIPGPSQSRRGPRGTALRARA